MSAFRLRPSSAGTWVFCPGSVQMQEKYPDESGIPALEGEASHWVGSEALFGRGSDPFINRLAPNGIFITQEMIDAAIVYVQTVFKTIHGDQPPKLGLKGHVEEQIAINRIHPECGGTPDFWHYDDETKTLYVIDYKYGWKIVECWHNWQLICYTIGIIDIITGGDWQKRSELNVVMKVVQPRPYHSCGPVREWKQSACDLDAHAESLKKAAAEAMSHNPMCRTGQHCTYCTARHACPAAQKGSMFAVEYAYQAVIQELPPRALGIEYRTLETAMAVIKARMTGLEQQIINHCNAGRGAETGMMVDRTGGKLVWQKSDKEVIEIAEMLGYDVRAPESAKTPTQVKSQVKDFPESLFKSITERTAGCEKLVPADKTLAAQVFGLEA